MSSETVDKVVNEVTKALPEGVKDELVAGGIKDKFQLNVPEGMKEKFTEMKDSLNHMKEKLPHIEEKDADLNTILKGIWDSHVGVFTIINCLLCGVNMMTLMLPPWFLLVVLIWFLPLVLHGGVTLLMLIFINKLSYKEASDLVLDAPSKAYLKLADAVQTMVHTVKSYASQYCDQMQDKKFVKRVKDMNIPNLKKNE